MTQTETRLEVLRRKLAARSKADGTPNKGYKRNVVLLKAEIARLDTAAEDAVVADAMRMQASMNPVEAQP